MLSVLGSAAAALAVAPSFCFLGPSRVDEQAAGSSAKGTPVRIAASASSAPSAPITSTSEPGADSGTQKAAAPIAGGEAGKPKLYSFPLKLGLDLYQGVSSVPGHSRFSDGLWAGTTLAAPSLGYARWDDGKGNAMRVSVGVGGMYTGAGTSLNQPVEAYWQRTFGATSVTVGKYWLPFGSQEWEYESRPGVMLQWSGGPHTLALSTNYNTTTHRMNAYGRAGRSFGKDAALGLSLGGGKGLTYDTLHDVMWGVDAMAFTKGFRFTGEYVAALRGSQSFGFTTAKVTCERFGAWRPYIGLYSWHDQSGALGKFYSQVYGMQVQLTPSTAIDTAFAPTSSRRTYWLQLHTSWER